MAFHIIGATPGRVLKVFVFTALFSSILIHFISFHDLIAQG
jgi:hypothetical protein